MPIGDLLGGIAAPNSCRRTSFSSPGARRGAHPRCRRRGACCSTGSWAGTVSSPPRPRPERADGSPQNGTHRARGRRHRALVLRGARSASSASAFEASRPDVDEASAEGAPIACSLDIGCGGQVGRVVALLLAKRRSSAGGRRPSRTRRRAGCAASRACSRAWSCSSSRSSVACRMSLGRLASPQGRRRHPARRPSQRAVNVRADGHVLLRGQPTTNAGQIAVRVGGRHGG